MAIDVTIYSFLVLASLAFSKLLIWGDDEEKKLQKIFGGLIVLTAALLTKNGWVVSTSIFISGLIVASEDFMRFLAAIMRTNGDKISDTVKALRTEKATSKEVEKKLSRESKESDTPVLENDAKDALIQKELYPNIIIDHAPATEFKELSSITARERAEKIKKVESLVQPYLEGIFPDAYEPQMKITNGAKALVVDGIVRKNGKIKLIVEIRYLTQKSFSILGILIAKFREKLIAVGLKRRVLMVVISEDMTQQEAQKMYEINKAFAGLIFFAYKNDQLEKIDLR